MKQKANHVSPNGRLIEAMDSDHGHQHQEESSQRGCRYEGLQGKTYVPCAWRLGCIKMFKRGNHEECWLFFSRHAQGDWGRKVLEGGGGMNGDGKRLH